MRFDEKIVAKERPEKTGRHLESAKTVEVVEQVECTKSPQMKIVDSGGTAEMVVDMVDRVVDLRNLPSDLSQFEERFGIRNAARRVAVAEEEVERLCEATLSVGRPVVVFLVVFPHSWTGTKYWLADMLRAHKVGEPQH